MTLSRLLQVLALAAATGTAAYLYLTPAERNERLAAVLSTAATDVQTDSTPLREALTAARLGLTVEDHPAPMVCAEWCAGTARARNPQAHETFYYLLAADVIVPPARDGRVLGDMGGGTGTVDAGCKCAVRWTYEHIMTAGGWRLYKVRAPVYTAASLKALAATYPAQARWWGAPRQVKAACVGMFGAQACANAAWQISPCWRLSTGDVCRYGMLVRALGPGDAEPLPCPVASLLAPMACVQDGGPPDQSYEAAAREWADAEINEAPLSAEE